MMNPIEELLRETIGLEASSIGRSTVERIVRGRMAQVGTASEEDYLLRLRQDPAELEELVEAVVIPESWFFRDGSPFTALAAWTRERWLAPRPDAPLRVLTVPCSTGEEPYSVAMTLLDAGLPPERFTVDAVDVSQRALARARQAVYGQNSFRGRSLDFRDRHFTPTPEGYALAPGPRRSVRFENGNLLSAGFRPGAGRFDVIFCRNLLIYFDRPTQIRAMQTLTTLLSANGLLFVGHAETGIAAAAGFVTANYPMAFAFYKNPALANPSTPYRPPMVGGQSSLLPRTPRFANPPTPRLDLPKSPLARSPSFAMPKTVVLSTPRPAASPPPAAPDDLALARKHADEGRLEEARRLCETILRRDAASAAAWYLLGVVSDAAGDAPRAAECYAKTLYLDPDHQEALLQRALLAESSGDVDTAAQLRRRIVRIQERNARP